MQYCRRGACRALPVFIGPYIIFSPRTLEWPGQSIPKKMIETAMGLKCWMMDLPVPAVGLAGHVSGKQVAASPHLHGARGLYE